jgi:hypothetical protein
LPRQTLRRRAIVITEIHYNPNGSENANQEWVEIFNTGDTEQDLSGWDWGDSQDQQFTGNFPAGTTRSPGKAAILVAQGRNDLPADLGQRRPGDPGRHRRQPGQQRHAHQ